jgi:hypothetical protein
VLAKGERQRSRRRSTVHHASACGPPGTVSNAVMGTERQSPVFPKGMRGILDMGMPGGQSGLALLSKAREQQPCLLHGIRPRLVCNHVIVNELSSD